jgi:ATP-dependent exoDNAse (exonuclease V) beta subunit
VLEHRDEEASRDEAEGIRVAYVAATRARDLLVVPAVGDLPFQRGWVSALNRGLYPPVDRWQSPALAPGCPLFKGKSTVLEGPRGEPFQGPSVRPGAYELVDPTTNSRYSVVWWDPLLLDAQVTDPRGVRREDLIAKDAMPEQVAADRARYDEWQHQRADIQKRGAQPTLQVQTATEFAAASSLEPSSNVVIDEVPGRITRPSGKRFGALVHGLLANISLSATLDVARRLADSHGRLLGATNEESGIAALVAHRALAHPLFDEARAAEANGRGVWREAPVTMVVDGCLVDGVVDLAFETDGGWTVVDFKSDVELLDGGAAYRRQIAFYVAAVAKATGEPVRGVLLRV